MRLVRRVLFMEHAADHRACRSDIERGAVPVLEQPVKRAREVISVDGTSDGQDRAHWPSALHPIFTQR